MSQVDSKKRWREALDAFRYPVSLSAYRFRHDHEGWFELELGTGDREETVGFEDQFRRQASSALEPWFEVVFWKLASQPLIRYGTTQRIAKNLAENTTAEELWRECIRYVDCDASEAKTRFREFSDLFNLTTDSIATVATFAAFMDPDRFPMIDTRLAKWVSAEMDKHNHADPAGPQLVRPKLKDKGVLKMNDFPFMTSWIQWCRHTARKLSPMEDALRWRARDVEMAVFTSPGHRSPTFTAFSGPVSRIVKQLRNGDANSCAGLFRVNVESKHGHAFALAPAAHLPLDAQKSDIGPRSQV